MTTIKTTENEHMLLVHNDVRRPFFVRIVAPGGDYGREDKLTNDHGVPLVEFYDATYADPTGYTGFGERGQFVQRYCADTLLGLGNYSQSSRERQEAHGLDLDGGVHEWKLDGPAMIAVFRWLDAEGVTALMKERAAA